jgi:L-aspartate oxidase
LTVDLQGRTTIPGLWAAGEVTSTGLHGANRLASNSLLEGLVYGAHAGRGASAAALQQPNSYEVIPLENPPVDAPSEPLDLADIRESLRSIMWRNVGINRDARGLAEAGDQVGFWCRYVLGHTFDHPEGWTLQNMLIISHLMIAAAARREESRGVHSRSDFPHTLDAWARHITLER